MKKLKVKFENVSKSFPLYSKQSEKLKELILNSRHKNENEFFALKNISFEVYEGETVGIIGLNGSGKSTLSNIIAQVIQHSSGEVTINGEPSLIAISAGLNQNLTGIENIELKCMMHGLSKEKIDRIKDEIIEFADVGEHINQPVKNYSSGMRSKLGFSIAVNIDPDILVIDEALSVGDKTFTQKSLDKMKEFKEKGKTIFFISHSASQVKNFCERAIWVHYGELIEQGKVTDVINKYQKYIEDFNKMSEEDKKKYKDEKRASQIIEVNRSIEKDNKQKGDFLKNLAVLTPVLVFGSLILLGY